MGSEHTRKECDAFAISYPSPPEDLTEPGHILFLEDVRHSLSSFQYEISDRLWMVLHE